MGNRSGKLSQELIASLKEDTEFSEEELKIWYKIFSQNCVDNTLSCDSFIKIYGKYFPHGDASKYSRRVFTSFDKDSDGAIDFTEFITTLNVTSHGTLEQKLIWAFKLYDVDSNGFVTKDELTEIVTEIYEMVGTKKSTPGIRASEKIVERIFQQMDINHDGQLSLAEFVDGGKSHSFLANMLHVDSTPFQRSLLKRPQK